jgi:hypothetical protein
LSGEVRIFHSTVVFELEDGKIWCDTRYFAEPFEAPEWQLNKPCSRVS